MLWRCVKVRGTRSVASYDLIPFSIDLYLWFVGVGILLQLNVNSTSPTQFWAFLKLEEGGPFHVKRGWITRLIEVDGSIFIS